MSHRGSEIKDVSPEQAEIIEWRAKRRVALRNQYLKEMHNPNSPHEGHLFDTQLFRLQATHQAKEVLFKPKPSSILQFFGLLGATWVIYSIVQNERDSKEHLYRTGQVSYRDRDWKFA